MIWYCRFREHMSACVFNEKRNSSIFLDIQSFCVLDLLVLIYTGFSCCIRGPLLTDYLLAFLGLLGSNLGFLLVDFNSRLYLFLETHGNMIFIDYLVFSFDTIYNLCHPGLSGWYLCFLINRNKVHFLRTHESEPS